MPVQVQDPLLENEVLEGKMLHAVRLQALDGTPLPNFGVCREGYNINSFLFPTRVAYDTNLTSKP